VDSVSPWPFTERDLRCTAEEPPVDELDPQGASFEADATETALRLDPR
jgi:hypothetical protein